MAVSDSINALVTLYMDKETPIVGKNMAVFFWLYLMMCKLYHLILYNVYAWLCNEK